nr:hypothetical protein [Rhodopirellula sp. SM50]
MPRHDPRDAEFETGTIPTFRTTGSIGQRPNDLRNTAACFFDSLK